MLALQSFVRCLCLGLLLYLSACKHEPSPSNSNLILSGPADGNQEVPPVPTTAKGSITGNYYKPSRVLNYTISWDSLSGAPDSIYFNADTAIYSISNFPTGISGSISGYLPALSAHDDLQLLAGLWYYNIKTQRHTNGEIRGQITAH